MKFEIQVENGEMECGIPCTPSGCPGHDNGIPYLMYLDGVALTFDTDTPDKEEVQSRLRLIEKLEALK